MAEFVPVPPFDIVVFGASGDLALRKLFPALFHRFCDGQIPAESRLIGVARQEISTSHFREMVRDGFDRLSNAKADRESFAHFLKLIEYVGLDATRPSPGFALLGSLLSDDSERPRVFYLATPPDVFVPICAQLANAGLVTPQARVVLEKPIGRDSASAKAINDGVGAVFPEDRVYRIDHYLGKETVQNLLVLRFANALFEPIWSRASIDHVQITVAETLGVGARGPYYDKSGALRDMVQNHLLQLLCLVAMEPPNALDADAIRTEKIKVMQALAPIGRADIATRTVRGQYRSGLIGEEPVKGYLDDLGENSTSATETFVAIRAEINNWRWAGVPFYLRTGKRLAARKSEIVIRFRPPPHALFGPSSQPNQLVIRLQPDEGMEMWLQIKEPGPGGLRVKAAPLDLAYADTFTLRYPDAYERLLLDVVRGNLSLFMRRDEVEAAWAFVDQIQNAWAEADSAPKTYAAGSDGPLDAALMMDRDGREWRPLT
jgi:glucose-6-phosphate 1-dehydrogenase